MKQYVHQREQELSTELEDARWQLANTSNTVETIYSSNYANTLVTS
jgi:thiamine pyrophosphokinase